MRGSSRFGQRGASNSDRPEVRGTDFGDSQRTCKILASVLAVVIWLTGTWAAGVTGWPATTRMHDGSILSTPGEQLACSLLRDCEPAVLVSFGEVRRSPLLCRSAGCRFAKWALNLSLLVIAGALMGWFTCLLVSKIIPKSGDRS